MAEQVAATPTDAAPQQSLDDKIAAKMGLGDEPEAPEQQQEPTEEAQEPVEALDDAEEIAPEEEPSSNDGLEEIKHNGQVKRLTKEQLRDFAQKGFDYESKMVESKAERQRLQTYAQALQAREAAASQALEAVADVKSFERQLQQYAQVDWVKYSNDDPIAAFQERQKYDALVNGYNQARQQAQAAMEQRGNAERAMTEEERAFEIKALLEKIPAWKDQEAYHREWPEINKWAQQRLGQEGYEQIKPFMDKSHLLSYFLRSTWKYERAIEANKAKKQTAVPQMPKPGSPQGRLSRGEVVKEGIKQLHQAKDVSRKKALFDDVLAAKFGLK